MLLAFKYNKKILMTFITIIGTAMSNGIPKNILQLKVFGIVVLGVSLTYIPKDIWFPSNSSHNTLSWRDYVSAGILGLSAALSEWTASAWLATVLDWQSLLTIVLSTIGGYLFKTYKSYNDTQLNQLQLC